MKLLSSFFHKYYKYYSKTNSRCFYDRTLNEGYNLVNEASIKDTLKNFSVEFTEGYACFRLKQCVCRRNLKNNEVFINKRTGFFMCEQCKFTSDWKTYSHLLEESKSKYFNEKDVDKHFECYKTNTIEWDKVVQNTKSLNECFDELYEISKSFNVNFFSKTNVKKLGIRINSDKDALYFPIYQSDNVVGYKIYYNNGEECVFPKMNSPGVLKSSKGSNLTSAVVVATIQDFIALTAVNLGYYEVICLPYGPSYIPQNSLPYFEKFEKIVLWLGDKHLDIVGNILEKFNETRCYIVKPTENQISATAALSSKTEITKILSEAKLCYHQYVTTFNSFRESILVDLQNPTDVVGTPWKKFPSLNNILKGHRRGELTILTGPTGVGKTTFLSDYSLDLAMQGVRTLWGSFEIKNTRLAKIMLTQFAKGPLPSVMQDFNTLCDNFEKLPIFYLTFHGQRSLSTVMDALYHCSYIYDIAHVIIDNVQFMIEVNPDSHHMDRFFQQDHMIERFRRFATEKNCHVTLVMHPKKTDGLDLAMNSIFGGVKASQEADNVMIIQKKEGSHLDSHKHLEIVKNRFAGDLGSLPIYFYKPALSFSEKNFSKIDTTDAETADEKEEEQQYEKKNFTYFS